MPIARISEADFVLQVRLTQDWFKELGNWLFHSLMCYLIVGFDCNIYMLECIHATNIEKL
jgi:hypothetical protein